MNVPWLQVGGGDVFAMHDGPELFSTVGIRRRLMSALTSRGGVLVRGVSFGSPKTHREWLTESEPETLGT